MAATVASLCSLLGAPTLPSHSPARRHHHPHPPLRLLSSEPRSLRLKTTLFLLPSLPFSPSRPHNSTSLAASAAAASYSSDDDEEEEEEEEEEEVWTKSRASSRPVSRPQEAGRLYVGNIPFSMTSDQLAEVFSEAGTVDAAEVMYDRLTGRSRGFAFVTMASVGEAKEAIRMFDKSQVGGRMLKVNFPEVPRGGEMEVLVPRMKTRGFIDSPYKVYAGNLGWNVTSQALQDAFASQPGLLGAKVIFDRDTGRSRGFGFVSFSYLEQCQSAIEAMNGAEIEGRPMRLRLAEGRPFTGSLQESQV